MPGVGAWPCSHPRPLWHISDLRGSGEVSCAKPWGHCNTVCSRVPPVPSKCWGDPTALPHRLPPLSRLPLSHPGQAFPSSCAVCRARAAHTGSALPHRAAAPHPSPERAGERLVLSLSGGDTVGRAAWGALRQLQHPQPCSEGCQTLPSLPGASRTSCCRAGGGDGEGEQCWLDPCSVVLLLSPAAAGAALPYPLVMAAGCRRRGRASSAASVPTALPVGMPLILCDPAHGLWDCRAPAAQGSGTGCRWGLRLGHQRRVKGERQSLGCGEACGGVDAVPSPAGNQSCPLNSVEGFSLSRKKWEPLPPMPTGRCSCSSCPAPSLLFVIGGVAQGPSGAVEALCLREAP